MQDDTDFVPFSRRVRVDEIRDMTSGEITASEAELEAIARRLELVALNDLLFTYRLTRGGGGRFRLNGQLRADVIQTCVVSLEPVEAHIEVPVEASFWPARLIEDLERKVDEPGSSSLLDWPEPIVDGNVDLGPFVYDSLALALEPYPKREGVNFDWAQGEPDEPETAKSGPFAALEALKRR